MADVTSNSTLEFIETLGKSKIGMITCIATVDDQDYIVLNTLTREDLVPAFATGMEGHGNPWSGLTTDTTCNAVAWDATVLVIKGAENNQERKIFFIATSDKSTGGD